MRNFSLVVFISFLFAGSIKGNGTSQLKYRIQCGTTSEYTSSDELKVIPDLRTFTLPTGSKIYFSGGYFNEYICAQKRLKEIQITGFDKAFIRVFKHSNILSKSLGDKYIEKVEFKISQKTSRDSEYSTKKIVTKNQSTKQKVYSRAEITNIKKKNALRKAKEKAVLETKERQRQERDLADLITVVKEPPVFKIFLGKSSLNNSESKKFKLLENEIVYTYKNRKETIYTVGFYNNEQEAKKNLSKYKSNR
jgi:hypothetical protein